MLATHLFALLSSRTKNCEAGTHGALRVILPRFGRAEDGQHVIAGVLQDLAAVLLDDRGELRERAFHHHAGRLGVEVLAQLRRAHDVDEQDRDLLELLL